MTSTPATTAAIATTATTATASASAMSAAVPAPMLHWVEDGEPRRAAWRSENGLPAPKRVVLANDTLNADAAYRLACEGTALLWRGDFQNARQLLLALARRADRQPSKPTKKNQAAAAKAAAMSPRDAFNAHRLAQSQRARMLAMVLVPLNADYSVPLRRAPDWRQACLEAYGEPSAHAGVVSLRELLGVVGAYEWHKNGVPVAELGESAYARIHPHYGVFSPIRGEYLNLIANAPLPAHIVQLPNPLVFDIGTGTGVLAAIMAQRGAPRIIATDCDPRALDCAAENIARIGCEAQVTLVEVDLFPPLAEFGTADLIVCNPPWLPARPSSPLERAIYDEGSAMLKGFLQGLAAHLSTQGEGWLIVSDLAEHLGLRSRDELLGWIAAAGLKVLGKRDIRPQHAKVFDRSDALYAARSAEVTSLWRLGTV
jgi:SAM-dependent methyltransferase